MPNCERCDRSFSKQEGLDRHLTSGPGGSYSCEEKIMIPDDLICKKCGKGPFSSKGNCKTHILANNCKKKTEYDDVNERTCGSCNHLFTRKWDCDRHINAGCRAIIKSNYWEIFESMALIDSETVEKLAKEMPTPPKEPNQIPNNSKLLTFILGISEICHIEIISLTKMLRENSPDQMIEYLDKICKDNYDPFDGPNHGLFIKDSNNDFVIEPSVLKTVTRLKDNVDVCEYYDSLEKYHNECPPIEKMADQLLIKMLIERLDEHAILADLKKIPSKCPSSSFVEAKTKIYSICFNKIDKLICEWNEYSDDYDRIDTIGSRIKTNLSNLLLSSRIKPSKFDDMLFKILYSKTHTE